MATWKTKRPIIDRLLEKVRVDEVTGCWVWTACMSKAGYGQFQGIAGTTKQAHRWSYELHVGPIPDGLCLDHLCRNRACVNPAHLEPVTLAENVMRGVGASALNARKTHCKNGHPLEGERVGHNGMVWRRECPTCKIERGRARWEAKRLARVPRKRAPNANAQKTKCVRGHDLSGDNVRVYVYGAKVMRQCVACRRDYQLAAKEERAAAKAARKEAKRLAKARAVER